MTAESFGDIGIRGNLGPIRLAIGSEYLRVTGEMT